MAKKWIAINLLLLVIAALFGWQLRNSIYRFKADNNLENIQPAADLKQKLLQEKPPTGLLAAKIYSPEEFLVIPEKNLFSETRSKAEQTADVAPPEPPPLAQKPILTGITISDTERKASIIDPTAPADQHGRRGITRRVGDVYQGYTITEISPDRIVLESGTRKEVLPLREGSKHGQGGKTTILSTRVVPIGGGGTTGGTPVSAASGTAPATPAPARPSPTPIGTSASPTTTARPGVVAQTPAPARAVPAPQPAQPAAQQGQPADPPATRVIRTPFGDIVRPAR